MVLPSAAWNHLAPHNFAVALLNTTQSCFIGLYATLALLSTAYDSSMLLIVASVLFSTAYYLISQYHSSTTWYQWTPVSLGSNYSNTI